MSELRILVIDEKSSGVSVGNCLVTFLKQIGRSATFVCEKKKKINAKQFDIVIVSAEWMKNKQKAASKLVKQRPIFAVFASNDTSLFWAKEKFLVKHAWHSALLMPGFLGGDIKEDLIKEVSIKQVLEN